MIHDDQYLTKPTHYFQTKAISYSYYSKCRIMKVEKALRIAIFTIKLFLELEYRGSKVLFGDQKTNNKVSVILTNSVNVA